MSPIGPQISVVIPTFNRAELLPSAVGALAAQLTRDFTYEVIFVDDGSTDDTPTILQKAVDEHPCMFRYLRAAHSGGPAAPRNMGIRAARGETILILDDDVIPDPDLLLRHWEFHQKTPAANAAALGELYLPPDVLADPMSLFHTFPYTELRTGEPLEFYRFWTCNVSLKRAFMLQHGMFNEASVLYPLEDMECGYRLSQGGLRLEFLPSGRGRHVHQMSAAGIPAKGRRLGRAQFAVSRLVRDKRLYERLRIVDPEAGLLESAWRQMKWGVMRLVENPATYWLLRRLGADGNRRSKVTDFYYFLIFRRNVLQGYRDAQTATNLPGVDTPQASELLSTK